MIPPANKYGEKLDVGQSTWKKWETTYCAAAKKSTIKNKASRGEYQFGSAHSAMKKPALMQPGGSLVRDVQPISLEALGGYLDNLVTPATNKKLDLEYLVANLTTLTTSNTEMAETIKNSLEKWAA